MEGEHVNGQQTLGENIAGGYFGTLDHFLALRIFLNIKNIPGGYFLSWPTESKLDLCSTENSIQKIVFLLVICLAL